MEKKNPYIVFSVSPSHFKGIEKTGLPVNIIIVSDHGMSTVPISKFIPIEKIENDSLYTIINNGTIINIHPNNKNQINRQIFFI